MVKHAWALVFFTVLAQMSTGTYILYKLSHWLTPVSIFQPGLARKDILIILCIAAISMIISFIHLGSPKNAFFAICNFKNSWLSREIFFMMAFIGIILLEFIFFKWIKSSGLMNGIVSALGILAALLFIYSMIKLYQLQTVPNWNSKYTTLSFFNSVLLAGSAMLILFSLVKNQQTNNSILLVAAVFLILQIVVLISFYSILKNESLYAIIIYGISLILILGLTVGLIQSDWVRLILFILLLSGITIERYLFYASYQNVGV
ncbi:MAG: dimethyl sulfoxide reductase anchor subunit [Mariniphaga sp.]|nr:dimethyl sulfoxide reductase anchor subunit [Mariniphaga sp.]